MMMHSDEANSSGAGLTSLTAKCPCCSYSTVASPAQFLAPTTACGVFAGLVRHPAVAPQAEANYRVSYDRSRQKRGPPTLILS